MCYRKQKLKEIITLLERIIIENAGELNVVIDTGTLVKPAAAQYTDWFRKDFAILANTPDDDDGQNGSNGYHVYNARQVLPYSPCRFTTECTKRYHNVTEPLHADWIEVILIIANYNPIPVIGSQIRSLIYRTLLSNKTAEASFTRGCRFSYR